MRRWKLFLFFPFLLLWDSAPESAYSQDPASELRRLAEAINQARTRVQFEADLTSYVFSADETTVTRSRIKYSYPYRRRECIESPGKTQFVVLEDGKYLWSYFPARSLVVKEPLRKEDSPFPLRPTEDLSLLMNNYEFVIRGPVPAGGGMECRIVEFIPKSADRPSREFWLEERWKVPIRVRVTSHDGRPAYVAELSNILWDPGLNEEAFGLRVPQDTKVYEVRERENLSKEEAERLLAGRLVLPAAIPKGYRPQNIVFRTEGPRQCLQFIYTDGLSSFSLFQEWSSSGSEASRLGLRFPVDGASRLPSARQYGMMNVVTLLGSDRRAVIVGDIPRDRLLQMAESLRESLRESIGEAFRQGSPAP